MTYRICLCIAFTLTSSSVFSMNLAYRGARSVKPSCSMRTRYLYKNFKPPLSSQAAHYTTFKTPPSEERENLVLQPTLLKEGHAPNYLRYPHSSDEQPPESKPSNAWSVTPIANHYEMIAQAFRPIVDIAYKLALIKRHLGRDEEEVLRFARYAASLGSAAGMYLYADLLNTQREKDYLANQLGTTAHRLHVDEDCMAWFSKALKQNVNGATYPAIEKEYLRGSYSLLPSEHFDQQPSSFLDDPESTEQMLMNQFQTIASLSTRMALLMNHHNENFDNILAVARIAAETERDLIAPYLFGVMLSSRKSPEAKIWSDLADRQGIGHEEFEMMVQRLLFGN